MNRVQKKAVARLAVIGFVAVSSAVLFAVGRRQLPPEAAGTMDMLGGLGFWWIIFIPGLIGLPPFTPFTKKGKIILDERDARVVERATMAAYGAFWYVFPILAIVVYLYAALAAGGPGPTINVGVLTMTAGGGAIMVSLVQSISILVQYGWGDKNHE